VEQVNEVHQKSKVHKKTVVIAHCKRRRRTYSNHNMTLTQERETKTRRRGKKMNQYKTDLHVVDYAKHNQPKEKLVVELHARKQDRTADLQITFDEEFREN